MNKICNTVKNMNYKIDYNVYDFFIKYKSIILITFFTGILVNAIDIFTIKFGVDAEQYAFGYGNHIYYGSQRYGSWLLYHLLPFARYHIISQIIGIFALTLAALLTISRHNISNNGKLLFMLLFVTFPNFAFLQYFYFQSVYNFIGLLFVVIAYRLIEKDSITGYILALILLFIGISSYQANLAVFLTVVAINIILDYLETKNIKNCIKLFLKSILFLVIFLVIYYICILVLAKGVSSHGGLLKHESSSILQFLDNIITIIWRIITNNGYYEYTANIIGTVVLFLLIIYIFYSRKIKDSIILILGLLLLIISIFSLNFVLNHFHLYVRGMLAMAFYISFIILLLYIFGNDKVKKIAALLTIIVIVYHASYIAKYQTAYYLMYKHDEVLAQDLMSKIYNKYPDIYYGKYNINIVGKILIDKRHPLMQATDVFNGSLFFWDNGHQGRIIPFMRLHGFPMGIKTVDISKKYENEIKNMPSYPNNDCIQLFDNTVLVKLSE